jgi:hypothetical protein
MKSFLLVIVLVCIEIAAYAQPNDSDIFESVTDTPIDTGLGGLLLLSFVYAGRKFKGKDKPTK